MLYLHRYSWGVIKKDVQDEFGLTKDQLGWLDAIFPLGYAGFQIPGGLAGDLLGPALVLTTIIIGWSAMMGAMALGRGFWSFMAIRFLFGVGQAGAYSNLSKVSRSWFPLNVRTTMQGVMASFAGRMGGACAPLIVGSLLLGWCGLGWRACLLLLAGAGVVLAVVFRLFFRNRPAEHPWANDEEQRFVDAGESVVASKAKLAYNRHPLVLLSLTFLLLHMFTSAFADQLYVNWVPMFLLEEKQLTKQAMGVFASLPLLGGALGGMFAGVLNDWLIRIWGDRRLARRAVGVTGKVVAAVLVVVSLSAADARLMMVVIAVAKFFTDWSQPTVWGAITDIGGPATGRVFGLINMTGSIGAFVAGPVLGKIIQQAGWEALFLTIAGIYVASGLCWLAIDTTKPLVVEDKENVD